MKFGRRDTGLTRRGLGAVAVGTTLLVGIGLAGCSNVPTNTDSASGGSGQKQPVAVAQRVQVTTTPGDGAKDVSPTTPMKVSVSNGSLSDVTLTNESGKAVKGTQNDDNTSWKVAEDLGYGKTYTWGGNAIGGDGKKIPVKGHFTTVEPAGTISAKINTADHATYGVGMPIKVDFSAPPADRAATERALSVQTSPKVSGSWAWLSPTSAHWRPRNYWKPGTKVTVKANLYGVNMGEGFYGAQDVDSSFKIGRSQVVKGDVRTHRFKVYQSGKLIKDMPASYGLDSVGWRNTVSGTHVVMNKAPVYKMTNERGGYRDLPVNWAVRISNNGEFTHSAPWSVWAQGNTNTSHGCVNLSPSDALWYFNYSQIGDPVSIVGSSTKMSEATGDYYDWSVPWKSWTAKSAL